MMARNFVAIWFSVALLALVTLSGGCTAAQRRSLDDAARDAVDSGKAVKQTMRTPAGEIVPEPVRSSILLGATLVEALGLAWLKTRKGQTQKQLNEHRKTLRSVVRAIEKAGDVQTADVKPLIRAEMKDAGIYDVGNKIVDELKAA